MPTDSTDPPRPQAVDRHLGRKLRGKRAELGLSAQELAWRSGIKSALIEDIEAGQRRMTSHEVIALSEALGVTVEWFFQDLA